MTEQEIKTFNDLLDQASWEMARGLVNKMAEVGLRLRISYDSPENCEEFGKLRDGFSLSIEGTSVAEYDETLPDAITKGL